MPHLHPKELKNIKLSLIFLLLPILLISQNQENYKLLWKIEGKQLSQPSYLFGTMHVNDARAFSFSDAVMPAIKSCDLFALEVQPDSLLSGLSKKIADKSSKDVFKTLLNDAEYKTLADRFFKVNGVSLEDSEIKDPNLILTMLYDRKKRANDKSTFVDMYLYAQAKTMQKDIVGLEKLEDQMYEFERMSPEGKRQTIFERLDGSIEDIDHGVNKLTEVYYTGDLDEIDRILNSHLLLEDETMISRNKVMASSIERIIKTKSLFSAVGTAHLPGEHGIISLLRRDGYTVTPVKAEFTGVADTFKVDENKMKWYVLEDENLGFSVRLPSTPILKNYDLFNMYISKSVVDDTKFMLLAIDLRNAPIEPDFEDLAKKYNQAITSEQNAEVKEEEKGMEGDRPFLKTLITTSDGLKIKSKMILENNIFYYLGVELDSLSDDKTIERFFNSISYTAPKPLEKEKIEWQNYDFEEGAFSIMLPKSPTDISRDVETPVDGIATTFHLNLYSVVDTDNYNSYLFRYNDVPNGHTLDNPEEGYQDILAKVTTNGSLVTEPKPITLQGYEGREYEVLLQDQYHTICRIYFRGNRTYLLLQQKLNVVDKVNTENSFFSDFKFTDYEVSPLETVIQEDTGIKISAIGPIEKTIDTLGFDGLITKNSIDYFMTDKNSGQLYQFGYADLQDYFKIKNKAEFYEFNIEQLAQWNDTILSQRHFKFNGSERIEAVIKNKYSNVTHRYQLWIQNKKYYLSSTNHSIEKQSQEMADSIFNSFEDLSSKTDFDIYASKSKLIFQDLKSKDISKRNSAIGAFDYYEFDSTELSDLHKGLEEKYAEDSITQIIKLKILDELYALHDDTTLEILKRLYIEEKNNDPLKVKLLQVIPNLSNNSAIDTYLNLLFEAPPQQLGAFDWNVLSPLRDSTELVNTNYNKFVELIKIDDFRDSVLDIIANTLSKKEHQPHDPQYDFDYIFQYAQQDLTSYIEDAKDTTSYNYQNTQRVLSYLSLMPHYQNDSITNYFTEEILDQNDNLWLKTNAVIARIKSNLSIQNDVLDSLYQNTTSRFDVMKAYYDVGKISKIPKVFLEKENFAKLSIENYMESIDEYGYTISLLGNIEIDGEIYIGASAKYLFEENESKSYTLAVGPIYNPTEKQELLLYEVTTDWTETSDNWESQVTSMLK